MRMHSSTVPSKRSGPIRGAANIGVLVIASTFTACGGGGRAGTSAQIVAANANVLPIAVTSTSAVAGDSKQPVNVQYSD